MIATVELLSINQHPAIPIQPVKSASSRIVCGTAGWIFTNYSTPFFETRCSNNML